MNDKQIMFAELRNILRTEMKLQNDRIAALEEEVDELRETIDND